MSRARRLLARAVLPLLLASLGLAAAARAGSSATILLYHRVGDDRYPTTNVSVEEFERQMVWLRENGREVVSAARLEAFYATGAPLPDKAVVIQFDDGMRSVHEKAFPILKRMGYPFTVFLPVDDMGYPDFLTWPMIAEMAAAGGEIGSHCESHDRLGAPLPGESRAAYADRLGREMRAAADALSRRGYAPRWVAYPYGEYNETVTAAAKAAGFALGFSQDPGTAGAASDPYALPRFAVVGGVAEFGLFRERLGYKPLGLADRVPAPGSAPSGPMARYAARVADPGRYAPGEVNLFVSELGRLDARFDSATGLVDARSPKVLTRRMNRVIVSLREKGTGAYALGSWLVLTAP